jgi:hypothetical protein
MMNRRKLICAGAAMLARVPSALAATYDLILKGGRVIDPSIGLHAIRDVAIAGGKIAAVEANIAGDATETVDVPGKIVAPGLIDIHTHAGRSVTAVTRTPSLRSRLSPLLPHQQTLSGRTWEGSSVPILLQKSQIARRQFSCCKKIRPTTADRCGPNHVTEVASEFIFRQ